MKFQYRWSVRTRDGLKTGEGKTTSRDEGSAELKVQEKASKELAKKKIFVSQDNVNVSLHQIEM